MFENVVVGVNDYQGGRDAIALAKLLASGDGEITLLYVEPLQEEAAPEADMGADLERQQFGLERLRRLRRETDTTGEVARIQAPSVRGGLHEFARARAADLIVIGSGTREPLTQMLLGDEARHVLEDAPCPVAVAPHGYSAGSHEMRKVGVAYDGSPESGRALALAKRLAAESHAVVSVFEAVPTPAFAHDIWNVEGEIAEDVEQARQRIAALGDVEPHAESADDAVAALRRFEETVDLLVLGAHAYRPPDRLVHRSKSRRLVDDPSSPLLVLAVPEPSG